MLTGKCITSRPLPIREGKKPLHILQILIPAKNGQQVVDVYSDFAGTPGADYELLPDVYMGKLTMALGGKVNK
jgi:hypothetical protein